MATTEEATAELFRLARRTAFNIAPEKAEALASEVFGTDDWELRPSRTEANFYAVVEDRAIYLSFAGLASLWCLTFVAYNVMDHSSRAARQAELKAQQRAASGIDRRLRSRWRQLQNKPAARNSGFRARACTFARLDARYGGVSSRLEYHLDRFRGSLDKAEPQTRPASLRRPRGHLTRIGAPWRRR